MDPIMVLFIKLYCWPLATSMIYQNMPADRKQQGNTEFPPIIVFEVAGKTFLHRIGGKVIITSFTQEIIKEPILVAPIEFFENIHQRSFPPPDLACGALAFGRYCSKVKEPDVLPDPMDDQAKVLPLAHRLVMVIRIV